jgi:hypothetical protein
MLFSKGEGTMKRPVLGITIILLLDLSFFLFLWINQWQYEGADRGLKTNKITGELYRLQADGSWYSLTDFMKDNGLLKKDGSVNQESLADWPKQREAKDEILKQADADAAEYFKIERGKKAKEDKSLDPLDKFLTEHGYPPVKDKGRNN